MSEKIKVMLVDDEQLIRSGLKIMLETYPDIEVIHQAGNGREAFECCKIEVPDVVLMDIRMPVSTGIEGTKLIKEAYPEVKIVMVTTFQDTEYFWSCPQSLPHSPLQALPTLEVATTLAPIIHQFCLILNIT